MDLILSRAAKKFIEKVEGKQAKQIAIKIKELESNPYPADSKKLKGKESQYYRVSVGEFRVTYRVEEEVISILLVGERNDNEVYNQFRRKITIAKLVRV